jgi:long-chain acyl-CoA synthetase
MYNVYQIITSAASQWPDKVALYDEFGSLTFLDLKNAVEDLKLQLQQLGVKEGMGMGVMGRNSRSFIISVFAGLGCGATIIPISHQIKRGELDQIIKETRLHSIVDDKNGVTPLLPFQKDVESNNQIIRYSRTDIPDEQKIAAHVEQPAFIRFSSGTTGKAKGVIISHQAVLERIAAANKGLLLNEDDNVLWVLPMAFHFIVSIVLYINVGASIIICNDFLASSILSYANNYNATLLYASPMHIRLLASDVSGLVFKSLKKVISTSTAIPPSVCNLFQLRYGLPVSQAYGIIEVGLPIVNEAKSSTSPDAVGFALPDFQVEVFDEQLNTLPTLSEGQLAIKGPGLFSGYLNPPTLAAQVMQGGWFLTGDLAIKDSEGLITISGRKKSMINVSGNKVFPEEVEQVLESHPKIKLSRVYGGKHAFMGEIVLAEIVTKDNESIETEELITFCREKLSTYKVPQKIMFVPEIAITASGKKIRF